MDTILGKLSGEQFYMWRFKLSEMQLAEEKHKNDIKLLEMMNKDAEIVKLRTALFRLGTVENSKDKHSLAKKEYEAILDHLKEQLGFELKDCVVDEITFEVKKVNI